MSIDLPQDNDHQKISSSNFDRLGLDKTDHPSR